MLLVALDTVATLVMPVLTRDGIDHGVQNHDGGGDHAGGRDRAGRGADRPRSSTWPQIRLAGRTGERLLYTLRMKSFAHLQRLGLDYYERELSGRIMTRMTTDVDAFSTFLQTGLTTALVSGLTFVGVLGRAAGPQPGARAWSWWPRCRSCCSPPRCSGPGRPGRTCEAREQLSRSYAYLQENVAGMRVVQAYRREAHNRAAFAELSDAYRVTRTRAQRYIAVYFPFVPAAVHCGRRAGAGASGAHLIGAGTLTAGALIAYLLYIDLFFSPIQQLSQVFDGYQQAAVGLRRISELLREPTSTPGRRGPDRRWPGGWPARIELRRRCTSATPPTPRRRCAG